MDLSNNNWPWLNDGTLFLTIYGSRAYNLHNPTSDVDIRGFCVPPKPYWLGFQKKFEQAEFKGDPDIVVFNIQKFFKLASDCNPSVIEILFTDSSCHLKTTKLGEDVLNLRKSFLSKKVRHTFSGYAVSQLKKIKTHFKYIHNPPTANSSVEELRSYDAWLKTRNPKRLEMELKWGYDCKHAMHLVRLMRMCKEILKTGEVLVKRPDSEELLTIRNGSWKYEDLLEWADKAEAELDSLCLSSVLPDAPDYGKLDELLVDVVERSI